VEDLEAGADGAAGQVPPAEQLPRGGFWADPRVASLTGMGTSILLHAVLIIGGLLFVPEVQNQLKNLVTAEEQTVIPTSELATDTPGGIPNPGMNTDSTRAAAQDKDTAVTASNEWSEAKSESLSQSLSGSSTDSATAVDPLGTTKTGATNMGSSFGGGGKMAKFGAPGGGTGIGPKGAVFGNGGNAYKIVFVVDGTGTMNGIKFDLVKRELKSTISKLKPTQKFNVIFFYENNETFAKGVDPKTLLDATDPAKKKAYEFLDNFSAIGSTNPLPAIEMAFKMQPQLMYVLSDGEFDNRVSYADVIKAVSGLNADKKVRVNTIMFGDRDPKAEDALKQIATGNGGAYVSVTTDALLKQ
jgi:hypothetical protein